MNNPKRELETLVSKMAELDRELLTNLANRLKIAVRVRDLRKDVPLATSLDRAMLTKRVAELGLDIPTSTSSDLIELMYAIARSVEEAQAIAFVGSPGSTAHLASQRRFGDPSTYIAAKTAPLALEMLTRGRADLAVLPFESSIEGPVQSSVVALAETEFKIFDLVQMPYDLHVGSRSGTLDTVARVYACASDLSLSEHTLSKSLSRAAIFDVASPEEACQLSLQDDAAAAVAPLGTIRRAGLLVALESVLDTPELRMRYAVVGKRPAPRTGSDLTSVVFRVTDEPGALLRALSALAEREVNVTKLVARPTGDAAWSYLFFVEVSGHLTDRAVVASFEDIRKRAPSFKILGSYPAPT